MYLNKYKLCEEWSPSAHRVCSYIRKTAVAGLHPIIIFLFA